MSGVSLGTIDWLATPPDERPTAIGYIEDLAPVLVSQNAYARLWGAGVAAVHHQCRSGVIRLYGDPQRLDVHQADLAWGNGYFDRMLLRDYPNALVGTRFGMREDEDGAAIQTIWLQAAERELIRLGHLEPEGLVEAQLQCLARSPEWWRRNRVEH